MTLQKERVLQVALESCPNGTAKVTRATNNKTIKAIHHFITKSKVKSIERLVNKAEYDLLDEEEEEALVLVLVVLLVLLVLLRWLRESEYFLLVSFYFLGSTMKNLN